MVFYRNTKKAKPIKKHFLTRLAIKFNCLVFMCFNEKMANILDKQKFHDSNLKCRHNSHHEWATWWKKCLPVIIMVWSSFQSILCYPSKTGLKICLMQYIVGQLPVLVSFLFFTLITHLINKFTPYIEAEATITHFNCSISYNLYFYTNLGITRSIGN